MFSIVRALQSNIKVAQGKKQKHLFHVTTHRVFTNVSMIFLRYISINNDVIQLINISKTMYNNNNNQQ